jgi:hypothetical protein
MKARIVKRTHVDGSVCYVIQQKHFLFRWWWVDAWINSGCGTACKDHFLTLEEARKHLCYFDETQTKEEVMPNKEEWDNG